MFPRIFFIFFLIISPSFGNESEGPSETECRPYIEKALQREGVTQETTPPIDDVGEPPNLSESIDGSKEEVASGEENSGSAESPQEPITDVPVTQEPPLETGSPEPSEELFTEPPASPESVEDNHESSGEPSTESVEEPESVQADEPAPEPAESTEQSDETVENSAGEDQGSIKEPESQEVNASAETEEEQSAEKAGESGSGEESSAAEATGDSTEVSTESESNEAAAEEVAQEPEAAEVAPEEPQSAEESSSGEEASSTEDAVNVETNVNTEETQTDTTSSEEPIQDETEATKAAEPAEPVEEAIPEEPVEGSGGTEDKTEELPASDATVESGEEGPSEPETPHETPIVEQDVQEEAAPEEDQSQPSTEAETADTAVPETEPEVLTSEDTSEPKAEAEPSSNEQENTAAPDAPSEEITEGENDPQLPEEELIMPIEIPSNLRTREHMSQILALAPGADEKEKLLVKTVDHTLKELKKLYDVAIKPLEILYKYRDLSNRHFGDPEIFSKPLILFMGPWSGGKSTIINYLLENEFKRTALRSGAEPSPAYFNIVMHGDHEEILDGTQLAADWTFSGLQKFGQGLLDRLRGLRLNHPLLQKVNIVEIPGILEIRKQVERLFPFNDACQWFIDRADIIFLVYDPSKLDVGPETEAILDQLKGREMQTRIILNKADQVKPEELMRVQSTLIWNISPLMSSTEPPVMYSTSLWSLPYEQGAPSRLLYAQECGFLKDLREAIDKRVENKIASARRFAVRVRNHAKMVDCYLTTYYNHKSFFGNKKKISDDIIEHPQNYHIYEGLSTLTNISRYDLPDPEVYKDFFRLNPVYEFQQLAATCTYFRGCPINRLDVAIAYDLPELVGKYKKQVEEVLTARK